MDTLPGELIGLIAGFLDVERDLCSFCLSSPTLFPWAQRVLYRDVYVSSPRAVTSLSKLFLRKPHLASFVRSLDIVFLPLNTREAILPRRLSRGRSLGFPVAFQLQVPGYIRVVVRALRMMTMLKSLTFHCLQAGINGLQYLSTCSFQLKTLYIFNRGLAILSSCTGQDWLEELSVREGQFGSGRGIRRSNVPLPIFPRLRSLNSSWFKAQGILCNHPIINLYVTTPLDSDRLRAGFQEMPLAWTSLQSLDIHLKDDFFGCLSLIATHLPSLAMLSILWSLDNPLEDLDQLVLPSSISTLPLFVHLRSLHLLFSEYIGVPQGGHTLFISRLSERAPSLRRVTFSEWMTCLTFTRSSGIVVRYTQDSAGEMWSSWRPEADEGEMEPLSGP